MGSKNLPAQLAANCGRPSVRGGWLAQSAVLALRVLHGHRQVLSLLDHDGCHFVGLAGLSLPSDRLKLLNLKALVLATST